MESCQRNKRQSAKSLEKEGAREGKGGANKARGCEITSPVLKQLLDKRGGAGCHKSICDRNHLGDSVLPEGLFTGSH